VKLSTNRKRGGKNVIPDYEQHPLAKDIPMMTSEELERLRQSMLRHGFDPRHPITLHENMILDGFSRYKVCQQEDIGPVFTEFQGTDPLRFLIKENLDRRHLSPAQRLHIMEKLRPRLEREAKERKLAGQTLHQDDLGANLHQGSLLSGRVNDAIAETARVSPRTAAAFRSVQVNGTPELKEAVKKGEISITDAAALVKETKDPKEQAEAVQAKKEGRARTAREAAKKTSSGDEVVVDANGEPVPGELRDAFGTSALSDMEAQVREQIKTLRALKRKVNSSFSWAPFFNPPIVSARLDRCIEELEAVAACIESGTPYVLCPRCKGKKCRDCRNCGHVPKWRLDELNEQYRLSGRS
jgi:hypothetical protein